MMPSEDAEKSSVRSVERAIDLLFAIEKSDRPLGVSELGRIVGIPKATALRLLAVLERRGLVQKEDARYQLGTAVVPLSRRFLTGSSLTRAAMPVLEELAALSGETACLYTRQGFDRVVIARAEGPHALRYTIRVGQRLPLYAGAGGLVLAAAMRDEELRALLSEVGNARLASGEQRTREELRERIEEVRREGIAISRQERELGVVSIAAPVRRHDREVVAAIAVLGPPDRMTAERLDQLAAAVRRGAEEAGETYARF